ncbi:ribonuclease H-like domain-containing protein [Mycena crocata]|nr:ribonuclease H-like domain-containing protein [Mycena crocata]
MTSKGSIEHFMRHYQIKAMSWMEIPALKFEEIVGKHKLSHNQVEFSARHNDMVFHPPQGAWDKSAPLRILSFDIETMVAPGNGFPRYQHEPIIQIGNMLKIKGESSPYSRCIFTLNTCPGIVGAEVKSYNTEVEMLLAWRDFVISNDPDIIVGHNIGCFDLPQLILRATVLLVPEFAILGRLKAVRAEAVPRPMNQRLLNEAPILAGRLQLDTWQYMSESTIPRTTFNKSGKPACDLNSVSLEFLGRKKEDISFTLINGLQLGRPEGRQRLAVYCLKDTHLPLLLVECPRLQCLDESIRAARLSPRFQYMPFSTYLRSGRRRY